MSVSFRGPDQLCATQGQEADFEAATETLGDRLVINQVSRHAYCSPHRLADQMFYRCFP